MTEDNKELTQEQRMRNTAINSFARKQADANSIIFEEDLDSDGELTVMSILKSKRVTGEQNF
jgi:hypothetical protein